MLKSIQNNFDNPKVHNLLIKHFIELRSVSPVGSTHVLDIEGLKDPSIKFWSLWEANELVGCGQYQNNMFYKIATMCRKDKVWDYYRVLKNHPYQEVAIKSSNSRTKTMDPIKITHYPKDKPYVLKFN